MSNYVELRDDSAVSFLERKGSNNRGVLSRWTRIAVIGLVAGVGSVMLMTRYDDPTNTTSINLQASSTCPNVENNIDYIANDIGSAPGSGASDCCTKCAQRSGCRAFTWSNYNGGTCWLKSGKGSTATKQGVVSAVLPTNPTSCPVIESNVDYVANDIGNIRGSGSADCCTKCSQQAGCGAFSWSNFNGGTCWLKSKKGATIVATGVVSGVLTRAVTPTPVPVVIPPAAPVPVAAPPPAAPVPVAAPPPAAPVPVAAPPPAAPVAPPVIPPPPAVAPPPPAPITPTATITCSDVLVDLDFMGNDIANVPAATVHECCSRCQQRGGCSAYTWTGANGGTCWLKSTRSELQFKAGALSGAFMVIPPSSWPLGFISGGASKVQEELTSPDGVVGNPTSYPSSGCYLPNYISRNNKIYVVGRNGEIEPMAIKGVNWFGMESGSSLPFGMWYNAQNGSTAYSIASFLQRNNFNSVRLPIQMDSLLKNVVPNQWIINTYANHAIKVDSYMNAIKSIVKAFAYRQISVLIDIHTLTNTDKGVLWYNNEISESMFLQGIDMLTSNLCNDEYYNIIGIDLKNEPGGATWGDGSATDFRAASIRIGNRMLNGCPNWLAFVEGIAELHSYTNSNGATVYYKDWWGAGLSKVNQFPVTLSIPDKVVYAPHYYSPAVYPADYFYGPSFTELPDSLLREAVTITFDKMFGYLAKDSSSPAIVLGEFGGLYTLDRHPQKTIQRVVQYTLDLMLRPGFSGGYVWSVNPESSYEYNGFNTLLNSQEGLLLSDWRYANEPFLAVIKALDSMPDLKPLQCFLKKT